MNQIDTVRTDAISLVFATKEKEMGRRVGR